MARMQSRQVLASALELQWGGARSPRWSTLGRARRESCEGLSNGGFGLPFAVSAEHGVDERDELAHDSDHGDLVLLAIGAQALEAGLHRGIAAVAAI